MAFTGHTGAVWAGAWHPDGGRILTGGADGTARLWESASGKQLLLLRGHMYTLCGRPGRAQAMAPLSRSRVAAPGSIAISPLGRFACLSQSL